MILVRLILAIVFMTAAYAKLIDLRGAREGLSAFGIPNWIAGPLSVILPVCEVVTAALLLVLPWVGSVVALSLLGTFTVFVAVNLIRGKRPSCNCFGNVTAAPISERTLLRNGLFLALAIATVSHERVIALTVISSETLGRNAIPILVEGLTAICICLAWMVFHLVRQQGRLLLALDNVRARLNRAGVPELEQLTGTVPQRGLTVGTVAPSFALPDIRGAIVELDEVKRPGLPTLLVFTHPKCGPCASLMPLIAQWQTLHAERVVIVLVSSGTVEENRQKGLGSLANVLLQHAREIGEAYGVAVTPGAVLIGRDGKIQVGLAKGSKEITELVKKTVDGSDDTSVDHQAQPSVQTREFGAELA
jgi:methylamine dehydrogenase accessory protein MauD